MEHDEKSGSIHWRNCHPWTGTEERKDIDEKPTIILEQWSQKPSEERGEVTSGRLLPGRESAEGLGCYPDCQWWGTYRVKEPAAITIALQWTRGDTTIGTQLGKSWHMGLYMQHEAKGWSWTVYSQTPELILHKWESSKISCDPVQEIPCLPAGTIFSPCHPPASESESRILDDLMISKT